jgi:hypothetical protein
MLSREDWDKAIARVPQPKKGCFKATYPRLEWQEVPCTTPPNHPYPPARGHRPETVGGSNDFAAEVTGTLSAAQGSFDSVSGVTSESGNVGGNPPAKADVFSLQLNTKPFTTSVCNPSPNPNCRGWQQFIYSNGAPGSSGSAFIQYWLLFYNTTCPSGWNTFQFSGSSDIYCWRNGANAASVTRQAITSLANLKLAGNAQTGGNDSVVMTTSGGDSSAANNDSMLDLAAAWKGVEFIVVGDCCSSQANFNTGSTIVVRTTTHSGTENAPTCVLEGFTGETNNLNLAATAAVGTGAAPAIVSQQSNASGSGAASCATANGVGDTHLTTFRGLLYDFQATGDFVLAETGPDFVVQTRQVSGAPTWPNASINKAVAVQAGKTRVAICTTGVVINGRKRQLVDGKLVEFADGGDVVRRGNVVVVRAPSGDSIRAVMNGNYIDVTVGLGRWPSKVRGLLANAGNGKVTDIEARDGTVLTAPFAFRDLYGDYANSWRVAANGSLLSPCGSAPERGVPQKRFFADDLDEKLAAGNRTICRRAGIKEGALLDACVIDVAVIGPKAANVFVGAPDPVVVGDAR